jgi:hypothetical protein
MAFLAERFWFWTLENIPFDMCILYQLQVRTCGAWGWVKILTCSLSQILSSLCSILCDLILQDVFADCVECKFTCYFGCRGHRDPNSSRAPQVCHNPDPQWVRGGTINRDANKHLGANYHSCCQDPKLVSCASLARHGISVLYELHIRGNSLCLWVLWVMQGKSCFHWF